MFSLDYAFTLETGKIALLVLLLHKRGRTALKEIDKANKPRKSMGGLPLH
jgi:hypothetical protein